MTESKEVYFTDVSSGSIREFTLLNFGNERCVVNRQPEFSPSGTTPIGDVRKFEIGKL